MLEILLDQRFKSGIPAGLPGDVQVAHKTGNISTVQRTWLAVATLFAVMAWQRRIAIW